MADHVDMHDLKKKTAGSTAWTFLRVVIDQLVNFIVFVVLARMLTPAQFGIFTISLIYVEIGRAMLTSGFVDTVVRSRTCDKTFIDTVFWANIAMATLLAVAGYFGGAAIGEAFGERQAGPLIAALGIVLPVAALGNIHMALRLREFGHRALATRSLVSGLIGGAAALAAAYHGFGVWSLVVHRVVTETIGTLMSWHAFPWLPGRSISLHRLREIAPFSLNMSASQLMSLGLARAQDVVISRMIGVGSVGIYRTAWKTIELIAQVTLVPLVTVSLVTFSKVQHSPAKLAQVYQKVVNTAAIAVFPAMIGFCMLAGKIVPMLYGEQWRASAAVVWVLAPMVLPFTVTYFVSPALAAAGRAGLMSKISLFQLVTTIALSIVAAPFGILAVAAAYVVRAYLTLPVQIILLRRVTGIGFAIVARAVAAPLAAALVMAAAVRAVEAMADGGGLHPLASLALSIASGAVVYIVAVLLLGGPSLRGEARRLLAIAMRRAGGAAQV
jgi:O-antigen/teichoic acid export membrane protein